MKGLLLLWIPACGLLHAQQNTATLRGIVTNDNGSPLAAVTVTITDATTGATVRQAVTGSGGGFEAPYLNPGLYNVAVDEEKFQKYLATGVLLDPGQRRRLDIQLSSASLNETTESHEKPSLIQTQNATLSEPIDTKTRWFDSPLVDVHPTPLSVMTTAPSVQGNGLGVVMSGISDRNRQAWELDGVADDTHVVEFGNPSFFETIHVTSFNGGVEHARPTGFDMISKHGTQSFHGMGYYKRGSSAFDSKPFFDPVKTPYRLTEAGGQLGGPIFPNHLYFFGGGIYQKTPYAETLFADVPTALMRNHDFSQYLNAATSPTGQVVVIRDPRTGNPFPNNVIPANRISSVAANFINNYYPSPNVGGANQFAQNYSWVHPAGSDIYRGIWPFVRTDLRFTDANHLFVRWLQTGTNAVAPGSVGELLNSTQATRYRSLVVSDSHSFAPNLINYASVGRTTDRVKQGEGELKSTPLQGSSVTSATGLQGVNPSGYQAQGFPAVSIAGLTGLSMAFGGGFSNNVAQNDTVESLQDGISWSKGRHAIRLGAQYMHFHWLQGTVPLTTYGSFTFSGQFSGVGFADFLLGLPATSTRQNPKVNDTINQNQIGVYLTDSFKVTSRLTLDYGVRWDYYGSPTYEDGFMYNWNPTTGAVVVAPGTFTSVSTLYPKNIQVVAGKVVPTAKTTNFRPRVAAAYRITDDMVLRGGYAEFTESFGYGASGRLNDPNGPYRLTETYVNSVNAAGVISYNFPSPFATTPSASLIPSQSITGFPTKTDEGTIRQYNVTLERVTRGVGLRLSYIGSRGVGMNYVLDINKPKASTTPFANSRRPFPQFASINNVRNDGKWRYDSAQIQAQKRLGSVLFDSSFTWANNESNYLNTYDPYNVTNHWTRDPADRRLYFVTSAIWDLPVGKGKRFMGTPGPVANQVFSGWTLAAVTTWASGQFYSPLFTGPDPANASSGFVTALPDCVGDPNSGARTRNLWFNPKAFSVPPANSGRYGTCGMNVLEGYPIHVAHASVVKRFPIGEQLRIVFTAQISNITNSVHFTFPNNNISNPNPGVFTAASMVPNYNPEKQGYRQIDLKIRLEF